MNGQRMQREVSGTETTVSSFRIIFADGSVFWARFANVSEHVLQPVLLKFIVICVVLHGILQWRADVAQLTGWWIALLWLCITFAAVTWFYLSGSLVSWLIRRGMITVIYTPFLTVPMVLVTETVTQLILSLVLEHAFVSVRAIIGFAARDIIVVLLYDVLFGSYVAVHHPLYSRDRPVDAKTAPTLPVDAKTVMPAAPRPKTDAPTIPIAESAPRTASPPPAKPSASQAVVPDLSPRVAGEGALPAPAMTPDTVSIGGEVLRLADIGTIHAEDHYVRIQMTDRRLLLRARFSDVLDQMAAATGLQINRSDWVSLSRIDCLRRGTDYRLMVVLADGEALPVARPRRQDVLTFAQTHGIAVYRMT